MKPLISLTILTLLLSGSALACDSYEDCIKKSNDSSHANDTDQSNSYSLQAIAYKLDEISKKLDKDKPMDKSADGWNPSWKSPKGQPYFDSVLNSNTTDHDLICSVCGAVVHPIKDKK